MSGTILESYCVFTSCFNLASLQETAAYLFNNFLGYIPPSTVEIRLGCSPHRFEYLFKLHWLSLEEALERASPNMCRIHVFNICSPDNLVDVQRRNEEKHSA